MEEGMCFRVFCGLVGFFYRLFQSFVHFFLKQVKGSLRGQLPPIKDQILLEPATVLAAKIRTGKLKSETVVRAYVDRIQDVNPALNAVVEDRFQAALQDARAADEYVRTSGKTAEEIALEKPFLGVPFTAKVSVSIKDLDLSSGLVARKNVKAEADCPVVSNMRQAGAIPLCVTNVPQLCMWGDASNTVHGTTHNPYDLTRIPGGSSGGEGTLVTSAASIFGIGNDIGGSIRIPSFCCGIFGHKPTKNVVSNKDQFPSSYDTQLDEMNCTGPMCRYSADLAPMLKVLAGPEGAAKLRLDEKVDLKKIKVYYTEDYIDHPLTSNMDPELRQSVRDVVQHLESTFGIKAKKVSLPILNSAWSIWMAQAFSRMPAPLTDAATKNPGEFNLVMELVKWLFGASDFTFNLLFMAALGNFYTSSPMEKYLEQYLAMGDELKRTFADLLGEDGIFVVPTSATTAPFQQLQFLKLYNYAYTGTFNVLGYPVTQCPTGLSAAEGLPLGVQIVSNLHNDRLTLAVAREIELKFGGWKSPSPLL